MANPKLQRLVVLCRFSPNDRMSGTRQLRLMYRYKVAAKRRPWPASSYPLRHPVSRSSNVPAVAGIQTMFPYDREPQQLTN